MSDSGRSGREGSAVALAPKALALGVLLIAVALLWQAAQRTSGGGTFAPPGPIGSLESVQLTNGLVFYGRLVRVDANTVRLDRVYEVQNIAQGANQAGQQRLALRHGQDWHGPGAMAIPVSNILFMEAVPAGSEADKLIRDDQLKLPNRGSD